MRSEPDRKKQRRSSLVARINVFLVLIGLPVVAISVLVDYTLFARGLNRENGERAGRSASAMALAMGELFAAGDRSGVEHLARLSLDTGLVAGVSIRGPQNNRIFDQPCPAGAVENQSLELRHEGELAGILDVCFDPLIIHQARRQHLIQTAARSLIISGLLLLAFNLYLRSLFRKARDGIIEAAGALSAAAPELSQIQLPYSELEFLEHIIEETSSNINKNLSDLRRTEKFSRMLIESMTEGLAVVGRTGRFSFVNARMAQLLGLAGEEVGECSLGDFLESKDYEVLRREVSGTQSGGVSRLEVQWTARDRHKTATVVSVARLGGGPGGDPGSLIVVTDISEQHKVSTRLLEYQNRLRHMSLALSLAEERERRRIAQEIHDNLSQGLALVQIKLEEFRSRQVSPSQRYEMDFLVETVEQLNKDARSLMFELSPPILYEFGFLAALEWLADKVQEERGLRVYLACEEKNFGLSEEVRVLAFQVVRELIVNVIKHARAKNVMLRASVNDGMVRVVIEDDGVGKEDLRTETLSAASGVSFGLFSIIERLQDIGGRFEIESYAGKGTRAMIEVPISSHDGTMDPGECEVWR